MDNVIIACLLFFASGSMVQSAQNITKDIRFFVERRDFWGTVFATVMLTLHAWSAITCFYVAVTNYL
jgi:hypothetical protein